MKSNKKIFSFALIIMFALAFLAICIPTVNAASVIVTDTPTIERIEFRDEYIEIDIYSKFDSTLEYYEVQFSTDSKFTEIDLAIVINESGEAVKNLLEPDTKYYVRARGCVSIESTQWSSTKKVSYSLVPATFNELVITDMYIHLLFSGYEFDAYGNGRQIELPASYGCLIEYSPSPSFDFDVKREVIPSAKSAGIVRLDNDLTPNQTYYFRIRSYTKIDGQTYYQKYPVCQSASYKLDAPVIDQYGIDEKNIIALLQVDDTIEQRSLRVQISDSRNFDVIIYDELHEEYQRAILENKLQTGKNYYLRMCYIVHIQPDPANHNKIIYQQSPWSNTLPLIDNNTKTVIQGFETENNSVTIGWKFIEPFYGCEVQYTQSNSFDDATNTFDEPNNSSCTIDNLAPGVYIARARIYTYRQTYGPIGQVVQDENDGYVKCYADWSPTFKFIIAPNATRLDAIKISDKEITLNWNGVDYCDGYEIRYSASPTFSDSTTIKLPNNKAISTTLVNNLIANTRYHFEIRSYCSKDGMIAYSGWSKTRMVTYKPTKTYIKHLTIGEDQSVIVDWKTMDYCEGYQIQYAYDNEFTDAKVINVTNASDFETHIRDLAPTMCYFRIRTVIFSDDTTSYSDWSNTKNIEFKFTKTYLTSQQVVNSALKVTWKAVNASSYEIQYAKDAQFTNAKTIGFSTTHESTDKLTKTINDDSLTPGTYYIRVRAINTIDNQDYYTDWSNAKTVDYQLEKTYIKNVNIANGQLKVDWKANDQITGYQIQYGTDSKLTTGQFMNVLGAAVDTCTIADAASGVGYVRIRTYKTIGDQTYYSSWSNIKTFGVNLPKTYLTNQYVKNEKAVVVWKTTTGCDGYEIQASGNNHFATNVHTVTVTGTNTDRYEGIELTHGTNYFRIRTYKTINGVKYYSDWSNAKTIDFN